MNYIKLLTDVLKARDKEKNERRKISVPLWVLREIRREVYRDRGRRSRASIYSGKIILPGYREMFRDYSVKRLQNNLRR